MAGARRARPGKAGPGRPGPGQASPAAGPEGVARGVVGVRAAFLRGKAAPWGARGKGSSPGGGRRAYKGLPFRV